MVRLVLCPHFKVGMPKHVLRQHFKLKRFFLHVRAVIKNITYSWTSKYNINLGINHQLNFLVEMIIYVLPLFFLKCDGQCHMCMHELCIVYKDHWCVVDNPDINKDHSGIPLRFHQNSGIPMRISLFN